MAKNLPCDLLYLDIRIIHYPGEITDEAINEEQFTWIFGKFCIVKVIKVTFCAMN